MHPDILFQISVAMVAATALAFAAKWLRQPLILAYVAAGVIIGPTEGFGWVRTHDIEPISELGLILLLFMIGLEIDLKKLRQSGAAVLVTGGTQFLICTLLGLPVAALLGFTNGGGKFDGVYFAVACALSSTMIVVKLLYDKFELDTGPGRITLGVLVFQDIWAILFLATQPSLRNPQALPIILSVLKGALLVCAALLVSRYVLPVIFHWVARVPEAMLITALAWCFGVSMAAATLGLSREMGALVAGISISAFPYSLDVIAKIISLRDFFITLFFVALGTRIPRPSMSVMMGSLAASAFVVASRFVSITPILKMLRSGNRMSMIPALNLAQISEFSLVICTIGYTLGQVSEQLLSVVVFTLVITSVTSTYMITYNHQLYTFLSPALNRLWPGGLDAAARTAKTQGHAGREICFLGFSRYASSLLEEMLADDAEVGGRIGVIDFNPQVTRELDRRGIANLYGDISHLGTLQHADIAQSKWLLSTIPDSLLKGTNNLKLLQQVKRIAPEARVLVTAEFFYTAQELYNESADFVFIPRLMSVRDISRVVLSDDPEQLEQAKRAAREQIADREEVLP